jgi:DNA-binding response OmpR family regulator
MTKRVLIIEDAPSTRAILQAVLEAEGYEVCTAATAAEALACLAQQPDVILLDQQLPDMSTAELLTQIKAASATPILLLTAEQAIQADGLLHRLVQATHPRPLNLRVLFKQVAALVESIQAPRAGLSLSELQSRLAYGQRMSRRQSDQASR